MKKVIVSGATSMLGSALIRECVANNVNVLAIVRNNSQKRNIIMDSSLVTVLECNLDDLKSIEKQEGEYDVFYHFAWAATSKHGRNDAIEQSKNIEFTLDAVKLAQRCGCNVFIGAGSQAEYGVVNKEISPDTLCNPQTAYGTSKFAAGKLSSILCDELGMRHTWARVFSVYGPNDSPDTLISYCIKKLLAGEKPVLTNCEQIWDYLHSYDAARAFYLLGEKGKDQTVYCIGSGHARPLSEYVEIIRDVIDERLPLGIGEKPYASDQIMFLKADIKSLSYDTGFIPKLEFYAGIKNTIAAVQKYL